MVANLVSMFILLRWLPMRPKLLYNERKKRPVRKPLRPRPSRTMLREIWTRPFQHWCSIFYHIFVISLIRLQNCRFFKAPAWDFWANERVRRKKKNFSRPSPVLLFVLTLTPPSPQDFCLTAPAFLHYEKIRAVFHFLEGWKYKATFITFAVSFEKIAQKLLIMVCLPLGE